MQVKGKKILHAVTLSSVGGAQSVVVNLANSQCELNEVYVLSSSSCEAWKALDKRVHVLVIKELQKNIGPKDVIVVLKLFYWSKKLRPDIVHLHSSKMGMFGRLVFPKKKTIYTVHGFDSMRIANRKLLFIEKLLKNRCRFIVGVSKYDEHNLKTESIIKNVTYVYNGVEDVQKKDLSQTNQIYKTKFDEIRKQYKHLAISIARDDAPKKIDLFINIAKLFPECCFVWIGNSHNYEVPNNCFLMGQIPMAYQLLKYADIFLLCSNYEGLPMSIIEALSVGLPVISSKVGGVAEILDGKNGFAVENTVEVFVEKIRGIFNDKETYKQFSFNARETYERKFTLNKMVIGYDNLYSQIIKLENNR